MYSLILLTLAAVTALAQPTSGPGGSDYRHKQTVVHEYGRGATSFWLYEPAEPRPASAPVVVFLHGWGAMQPRPYEAWIEHIVRRGNIVIYPRYQDSWLTSPAAFTPNAVAAIKSALRELQSGDHAQPDLERVAVVGHSMGGAMTANIAAVAGKEGLPAPKAIMPVEPGSHAKNHEFPRMPLADFRKIPATALMLVVVGDNDARAGTADAKLIFRLTPQITPTNKNYVTLVSDRHGTPPLRATHHAPLAANGGWSRWSVDALDFFGTWKLFDALTEAAFYGTHREFALGNTPQQRFMGLWSDGVPVKELVVTDRP